MLEKFTRALVLGIVFLGYFTVTSSFAADKYCTPPSFISGPYTGITEVGLDAPPAWINTSPMNDGYIYYDKIPASVLTKGKSYTISIKTEEDFNVQLNMRVWIDWNGNGSFDDAGDLAATWNNINPGKSTATFKVPDNAVSGITRMRVYEDMNEAFGHITPNPCGYLNFPNHEYGHHGNVEDYNVNVQAEGADVKDYMIGNGTVSLSMRPNPVANEGNLIISYPGENPEFANISIVDITGREIKRFANREIHTGLNELVFDTNELAMGQFFFVVGINTSRVSIPFSVVK